MYDAEDEGMGDEDAPAGVYLTVPGELLLKTGLVMNMDPSEPVPLDFAVPYMYELYVKVPMMPAIARTAGRTNQ